MDTVQTLFKILLLLARALDRPIKCVCVCVCVCVGAGKGNALVPYKSLPWVWGPKRRRPIGQGLIPFKVSMMKLVESHWEGKGRKKLARKLNGVSHLLLSEGPSPKVAKTTWSRFKLTILGPFSAHLPPTWPPCLPSACPCSPPGISRPPPPSCAGPHLPPQDPRSTWGCWTGMCPWWWGWCPRGSPLSQGPGRGHRPESLWCQAAR